MGACRHSPYASCHSLILIRIRIRIRMRRCVQEQKYAVAMHPFCDKIELHPLVQKSDVVATCQNHQPSTFDHTNREGALCIILRCPSVNFHPPILPVRRFSASHLTERAQISSCFEMSSPSSHVFCQVFSSFPICPLYCKQGSDRHSSFSKRIMSSRKPHFFESLLTSVQSLQWKAAG